MKIKIIIIYKRKIICNNDEIGRRQKLDNARKEKQRQKFRRNTKTNRF